MLADDVLLIAGDDIPYHLYTKSDFLDTNETQLCFISLARVKTSSNKKHKSNPFWGSNYEEIFENLKHSGNLATSLYMTNQRNGKVDYYKNRAFNNCMKQLDERSGAGYYTPQIAALCGFFKKCKESVEKRFSESYYIGSQETPKNYRKYVDEVGKLMRVVINNRMEKLKIPMKNTETIWLSDLRHKAEKKEMRKLLKIANELNVSEILADKEIDARFNLKSKYFQERKNNPSGEY